MVFGCISKIFPENIFWCLEKKKENTNLEKHKPQPRSRCPTTAPEIAILPSSQDCDRRRDLGSVDGDLNPVRSHEGEIAIFARSRRQRSRSGAISRRRDPDLDLVRSRSRSGREIRCDHNRTRALCLSFFGNTLKGK